MREVKPEHLGFRDMRLSERHRRWGWDCPAVDIDFFFLEYDKGNPTAIVEYKHEHLKKVSLGHPTYHAMTILAEKAEIPFFVVRYKDDFSAFHIIPVNSYAKSKMPDGEKFMSESTWVRFLYWLRGYECPQSIIDGLKTDI